MTTTYTTHFDFPLLEAGSDGWDAVINGMFTDLDALLYQMPRFVAEGVSINLNAGAGTLTTLYTAPAGYKFIPLMIILRDFSNIVSAAVIDIGLGGGGSGSACDEFLASQILSGISASASYLDECLILQPIPNATPVSSLVLDEAEILALQITTANGTALTCVADVFGKLILK